MSAPRAVEITRRSDGVFVEAMLHEGLEPRELLIIERQWSPVRVEIFNDLLALGIPRSFWPQSLHWNWLNKAAELSLLESTGFGIILEGEWQGVMLTKTASPRCQDSCRLRKAATLPPPPGGGTPHGGWRVARI